MSFFPDSEARLQPYAYQLSATTPTYSQDDSCAMQDATWGSPYTVRSSVSGPSRSFGPSAAMTTCSGELQPSTSFAWTQLAPSRSTLRPDQMWPVTPSSLVSANSAMTWTSLPFTASESMSVDMYDTERSTVSATSVQSSPYIATASHFLPEQRSPYIKHESPFDGAAAMDASVKYEQGVNPLDIVTKAPSMTPSMSYTPLVAPSSPDMTSQYPHHHHHSVSSYSCDTECERPKRKLTTPEEAKFHCGICDKPFKRNSNLMSHMKVHNPERNLPFSCEYAGCNQRFARGADKERHKISVHLRTKPHRCVNCHKSFARKDTMSRHQSAGCLKQTHIVPRREAAARRAALKREQAAHDLQHSSDMDSLASTGFMSSQYPSFAQL